MTLNTENPLQSINHCYFCKFGLPVAYETAMQSSVYFWTLLATMFVDFDLARDLYWLKPNYQINLVVFCYYTVFVKSHLCPWLQRYHRD